MRRSPALFAVLCFASGCASAPPRAPQAPVAHASQAEATPPPLAEPPVDAPTFAEASRLETGTELARVLASHPEIESLSLFGEDVRIARIRQASGSTICAWHDSHEPRMCIHDTRNIENVWLIPDEEALDEHTWFVWIGIGPFNGSIEAWRVDFANGRRQRIGTYPAQPRVPDTSPFFMGGNPDAEIVGRFTRTARAPTEDVALFRAPDWIQRLNQHQLSVAPGAVPRIVTEDAKEVCLRVEGRWRCGTFADTQLEELEAVVERVEIVGEGYFAVQRSMRVDGGHGDGSGAHGTSELHIFKAEGDALVSVGWLPIGAMTWETQNLCDERHDACFFRHVDRTHRPWSVDASGCVTFSPAIAEQLYTGYEFMPETRAGGQQRPVRALTPSETEALVGRALEDRPGALAALIPFQQAGPVSYRFTNGAFTPVAACPANTPP